MSMVEHSITEIIKQYLIDASAVGALMTDAWPCYQSVLPDSPDNAVGIFETSSVKQGRLMTGVVQDRPGFQVVVRGRTYTEAYDRADVITTAIDAVVNTPVDVKEVRAYVVHNLTRDGLPIHIPETGGRRRSHFSINGTAALTEALLNAVLFQDGDVALFQDGDEAIWQDPGTLPPS